MILTRVLYVVTITFILVIFPIHGYAQADKPCIPATNLINDVLKCFPNLSILNDYLISKNFVGADENYPFYHYNILSKLELDIQKGHGIYVFGQKSSHPVYCIYFQNNNGSIEIISNESIGYVLSMFSEFCNNNGVNSDDEKLVYLHGLISYLNVKNGYPISHNCLNFECD